MEDLTPAGVGEMKGEVVLFFRSAYFRCERREEDTLVFLSQ